MSKETKRYKVEFENFETKRGRSKIEATGFVIGIANPVRIRRKS